MSTSDIPQPTQAAMLGSTPSNSSFMEIKNNQNALLNLKKVGGKGKRGGAASGTVAIPIVAAPYTSANGSGQDTTTQQQVMAKLALQAGANSKYDHLAVTGGSRKSRSKKSRSKKSKKSGKSKKTKSKKRRYHR
jgi:hypothetical protein